MSDKEEDPTAGSGDDDSNGDSGTDEGNSDDERLLVPTAGQAPKKRRRRREASPPRHGAELGRQLQLLQWDRTIRLVLTMEQARDFSLMELIDTPVQQQESAEASRPVGMMQAIIEKYQEEALPKGRGKGQKKKKKSKDGKANMDEYDSDDSWIDDSEMVDEVDTVQTKYGGFYICKDHIEDADPSSSEDEQGDENSDGDFAQVEVHRSKKGKQQLTLSRKRRESVPHKQKQGKKQKKSAEPEEKVVKKRPKKTGEEDGPNKKVGVQEENKEGSKVVKRKKKRVDGDEAAPRKRKATSENGAPGPKKQKVDATQQDKEVTHTPPPPLPDPNGEPQPAGKARLNFKKSKGTPAPPSKQPTADPSLPRPSAPKPATPSHATSTTTTAPEQPSVPAPPPISSTVYSDDDVPLLARPKPKVAPQAPPAAPKAPQAPASDGPAKPKKPRKPRTPKTDTQSGDVEKKPAKPRQSKKATQQAGEPAGTPAASDPQVQLPPQPPPPPQPQDQPQTQPQSQAQAQPQGQDMGHGDAAAQGQAVSGPTQELQQAIQTSAHSVMQWVDRHDPSVPLNQDGQYVVHFMALADGKSAKHLRESLAYLKNLGLPLSAKDKTGNTALHTAVSRDKIQTATLKALLPFVDLDAQNNEGDTCLHVAVRRGKVKTAKLILEAEANINIRNVDGKVPLDYAFTIEGESMQELVKLLFEAATTNSASKRRTPPTASGPSSPINTAPVTSPRPPVTNPTPTKPAAAATGEPKKRKLSQKKAALPATPTEKSPPGPAVVEPPNTDSGGKQAEPDGQAVDTKPPVKQLALQVSPAIHGLLDTIQQHAANTGVAGRLDQGMVDLLADLHALLDTEGVKGTPKKEIIGYVEAITGAKSNAIKYKLDEAKAQRSIEPMKARLRSLLDQGGAKVHESGEAEFSRDTTNLLNDMTEVKFRATCRHKGRKVARTRVHQFFKELVGELWPDNTVIAAQLMDLTASIHADPPAARPQQDDTPVKENHDSSDGQ